ncbi:site-specific integrase [Acidithiobacillus caldus]|nr:site-specific integrase [Acidithiobacillus caldus]
MLPVAGGHLLRRGRAGFFTYRYRVPPELRERLSRTQIWYALKTTDLDEAQERAARIWLRIREMSRKVQKIDGCALGIMLLRDGNIHFTDIKPEDADIVAKLAERLSATVSAGVPVVNRTPSAPTSNAELASVAWSEYERAKIASKRWSDSTLKENKTAINLFLQIAGDRPMSVYSNEDFRQFVQGLMRLPKYYSTSPAWRGRTISELAKTGPGGQEPKNINKQIRFLSAFFDWYCKAYYEIRTTHTLANHLVEEGRKTVKDSEIRKAMSDAQLQKFYQACLADVDDKRKKGAAFKIWLVPLAAYTGARIGELGQLRTDDVRQVDGVWVFDLLEIEDGQSLKTAASRRQIPVHQALIDGGFLDFVKEQREKRRKWLWGNDKVIDKADVASKTANRLRNKIPEISGKNNGVSMHSVRHSFITKLKNCSTANDEERADLAGHARKGTEGDTRYYKTDLSRLQKHLNEIMYDFNIVRWIDLPG